ncbi:GMC family oxidoreductase [Parahaliea aestuarii]|uniref:GMC family oxidoreductase n=1 Tax=Parahaliea aestuarii TaxID=1852021 RepID=A0A5C8ZXA7_9GAMM|nr:GMC family oxidoreductase [Parahaliea aestuarii]TXS93106.1 GMC family oxidoreductase [Parahaliea aestuarii]
MTTGTEWDVCVIGSGAGGGVMAERLSAAGMKVVVLERGRHYSPDAFLHQDELGNVIRQDFFLPDYRETQRETSADKALPGKYSLMAQTVGGGTVHWGSWSWRFRPDEFRVASTDGVVAGSSLVDWPIGYDELKPYYDLAEQTLGMSGLAGSNPFAAPGHNPYPNPAHVYRPASRLIEKGAQALDLHPFPIPMAINSRIYGGRGKCMNSGFCSSFGCPVQAKASSLAIHIPAALATGNCTLLANCQAVELVEGEGDRLRGVRYLDSEGREQLLRARQIVLSAGSIGTTQLLLQSTSSRFPRGLLNNNDQVGRNLMCHVFAMVNFEMEAPSLSALGPPGNVAVDDFHPSDSRRGFVRGGVIGEAIEATPIVSALKAGGYLRRDRRVWGRELSDYLSRYPHIGGLIMVGEDLPVADNRIDLDPDHRDSQGLPLPRITHQRHDNDIRLARYFEQRMGEIARAGGASKTWATDYTGVKTGSGHIMGTCRMGDDPETSVLNRWCRAHDISNLWVVDGSCFPTSGGYNPTLTIYANAYRVADHFVALNSKGELS